MGFGTEDQGRSNDQYSPQSRENVLQTAPIVPRRQKPGIRRVELVCEFEKGEGKVADVNLLESRMGQAEAAIFKFYKEEDEKSKSLPFRKRGQSLGSQHMAEEAGRKSVTGTVIDGPRAIEKGSIGDRWGKRVPSRGQENTGSE